MSTNYVVDLKVARRKSGLLQADCAHLLNVDRSKISRIENGDTPPNITELCILTLIYGKPYETLFEAIYLDVITQLQERLNRLPTQQENRAIQFNRSATIVALAGRLETLDRHHHGNV